MKIEFLKNNFREHTEMANAVRMLSIEAVEKAKSGHPGMPMGFSDVATVLFTKHLKFDPSEPNWINRDRFILSAGHGSMLLYSLLYLCGYPNISLEDIKNFRQINSPTAGHPEYGHIPGIETTTGPLGQGLSNGVGFAIAEESLRNKWGNKIIDHFTYVIAGDGCLMEGISQEAIGLAGKLALKKLIVLWDDNGITIDGEVNKSCITNQEKRFEASEWSVFKCDGHNPDDINEAIKKAKLDDKPSLIRCSTHIGFGSPTKQDTSSVHGSPLGKEEIDEVKKIFSWDNPPFHIPESIKNKWESLGNRGKEEREDWKKVFSALSKSKQKSFERVLNGELPNNFKNKFNDLKKEISLKKPKIATRKSSEITLDLINRFLPETIGGSADLTGSNNTFSGGIKVFDKDNRDGRYIHYGIREHAMAATMNGIALHGGLIPYGGTFMAFTDYARGSIRLSALMGLRTIYVMTHDSIGLGEDGPTHQPVEHLSILRSTPNLLTFRPADTIETIEAWQLALSTKDKPSVLALSRQNLPTLRTKHNKSNLTSKGAYVIKEWENKKTVILISSGSEVEIAIKASIELEKMNIGTRVVSMPCWEIFSNEDEKYRKKILPRGFIRIGIEAGTGFGWEKWLCSERGNEKKSAFIGINSFGASGPADELYKHFGITKENIINKIKKIMDN